MESPRHTRGDPSSSKHTPTSPKLCEKLDRKDEAVEHWSKVASTLKWIQGNLDEEYVASYMNQPDVRMVLDKTLEVTGGGGAQVGTESLERCAQKNSEQWLPLLAINVEIDNARRVS